jgi:hypothetical protein
MGQVAEEIVVPASLAETWDFYFEPRSWPGWVDGFHSVEQSSGYPESGGTLRWRGVPSGRGTVAETVLEHEPRRLHRIRYSDPESEGELLTTFAIEGDGTRVRQELVYGLVQPGLFGPLTDRFFVRSQMRRSLVRSLGRLRAEVTAEAARTS